MTAVWTNVSKSLAPSWTNVAKTLAMAGSLLKEDGGYLLQESGFKLLLEQSSSAGTTWSNLLRSSTSWTNLAKS